MKSKVYFTKEISPESLVKMYHQLNYELPGKVAVKISTGEAGNPNYLKPELIKKLVDEVNGTIVECNTAYAGKRNTTEEHIKTIRDHGFFDIAPVDIMDQEDSMKIPVVGGTHMKENYVGSHLQNYDSILMLSHFKGHPMGGFGGALKNMSIGVASSQGKSWIHSGCQTLDPNVLWDHIAPQDTFLECMAEACRSVVDYMDKKVVYINVVNNLTVDCDCVATPEDVCMKDIGVLASLDPVALDKACVDLIENSSDPGKDHMMERIERQHGTHILEHAEAIQLGTCDYELIEL